MFKMLFYMFLQICLVCSNYDTNNLNLKDVSELLSDLNISEDDINHIPRRNIFHSKSNRENKMDPEYGVKRYFDNEREQSNKKYNRKSQRETRRSSRYNKNRSKRKAPRNKYKSKEIGDLLDPGIGKPVYTKNRNSKKDNYENGDVDKIDYEKYYNKERITVLYKNEEEKERPNLLKRNINFKQKQRMKQKFMEQVIAQQRELENRAFILQQQHKNQLIQHQNALDQQARLAIMRQQAIEQERIIQEQFIQQQALEQQRLLQVHHQQELFRIQNEGQKVSLEQPTNTLQPAVVQHTNQRNSIEFEQPLMIDDQHQLQILPNAYQQQRDMVLQNLVNNGNMYQRFNG